MTSEEWDICTDPQKMLDALATQPTDQAYPLHRISKRKGCLWLGAVRSRDERKSRRDVPILRDYWLQGKDHISPHDYHPSDLMSDWVVPVDGNCPQEIKADLLREIVGNPYQPLPVLRQSGGSDGGCELPWLTAQVKQLAQIAYNEVDETNTLARLNLLALADALEEAGCPLEENSRCPFCKGQGFIRRPEKKGGPFQGPQPKYVVEPPKGDISCIMCQETGRVKQPNPILSHLRSNHEHVRGCWGVDLILGLE